MERYKNLSGKSGVHSYEIGGDCIEVQFNDRAAYLYDYESAGSGNIEKMRQLAKKGIGLNTFINKYVKKNYARKLRWEK